MTGRERIMTALNRATPDTVPVWELAFNEVSIIGIARNFMDASQLPEPKLIEDMSDVEAFQIVNAFGIMARELGLDGVTGVTGAPRVRIDSRHLRDANGVIHHCSDFGEPYPVEGPIKDASDLKDYKMRPPEDIDFIQIDLMKGQLPDTAVAFMLSGPFFLSWSLRGSMQNLLMDYVLNPQLARDLAEMITEFDLACVEKIAAKGADFIVMECDLAHTQNTIMSPAQYEDFIGPYHQRIVKHAHDRGLKMVKHSDGMLKPFYPYFIEEGFDAIHPIQPDCLDIGSVKREFGDKLCVMGNIDCSYLLVFGSPEDVDKKVKETIEIAAPGGGYIISSSNTIHPGVKPENYIALVKAARKYGKYN